MRSVLACTLSTVVVWFTLALSVTLAFNPTVSQNDFQGLAEQFFFDDSHVILIRDQGTVYRSIDDGKTFEPIDLGDDENGKKITAVSVKPVQYDNQLAFIFTSTGKQFYTKNQGETWEPFQLPFEHIFLAEVSMNYANHDLLLFNIIHCDEGFSVTSCKTAHYYSKDALKTPPQELPVENIYGCVFAKSTEAFTQGPDSNIVCMQRELDSFGFVSDSKIISSSDYFKTATSVSNPSLKGTYSLSIEVYQSFIVAIVKADRYVKNGLVDIYVSKDGVTFSKALFENSAHDLMYEILPSTPDSLNVAMYGYADQVGQFLVADIYKSDSSGVFFTKTLEDVFTYGLGLTTAQVQEINGVWIAPKLVKVDEEKRLVYVKTKISYDDGETWSYLKLEGENNGCEGNEKCSVQLISVVERDGSGRAVTGPTPGFLMGLGAAAEFLPPPDALHTYFSRNGGLTWKKVFDHSTVFTFADMGNIIVAAEVDPKALLDPNAELSSKLHYSLDQGETWQDLDLGAQIIPLSISTATDGTSQNVLVIGISPKNRIASTFAVDFSSCYDRTCGEADMEEWTARLDPETNTGICVDGYREKFMRRKQNADCFVRNNFKDLEVIKEPCECSAKDVECAYGFIRDKDNNCKPSMKILAKYCPGVKGKSKKLKLSSKQKIPTSPCKGSVEIPVNDFLLDCKVALEEAQVENIKVTHTKFDEPIESYIFLDSGNSTNPAQEETLLVFTESKKLYASFNGGLSFMQSSYHSSERNSIASAFLNPYFADQVYIVTADGNLFISHNRARSFDHHSAPSTFTFGDVHVTFDPLNAKKFLWYATICRDSSCRQEVSYTTDGGVTFTKMLENAAHCYFAGSLLDSTRFDVDKNLIICDEITESGTQLVSSSNFFQDKRVIFDRVAGTANSGVFMVTAVINQDDSLTAYVSVDGNVFAEAALPPLFKTDKQKSYTVLKSSSETVFLHIGTSAVGEFGSLLKSNYNGTNYVESVSHVNRNVFGYVDFELIENMEGIITVNIVVNPDEVERGEAESLKTSMSHNDGGTWSFIAPPIKDSEGKAYSCNGKSLLECSLNIHTYTDRVDTLRDTASSGSAIGMLFAVGNVGKHLLPKSEGSTFFSKDAGITWKEVVKGNYMWEYGDQGTFLVLVNAEEATDHILISTDEGDTWTTFKFADEPVYIRDILTVPSDTSRSITLISVDDNDNNDVYMLDFTSLYDRQCILDPVHRNDDDFEVWTPKHPFVSDNCLFGHVSHYLHRSPSSPDCFIGGAPIALGHKIERNCQCTRQDFECDYNFALASDGTCKLIEGLKPQDHAAVCSRDPEAVEYWEPTGYRKVPLSTCEGGLELDKWVSHPCPGHERDYNKEHHSGLHGFNLFLVIFVPLLVLFASLLFLYDRGIKRNGGFARLGEIRLDDDNDLNLIEENTTDKVVNAFVKFGVYSFVFMSNARQKIGALLKGLVFGEGQSGGRFRFTNSSDNTFRDIIIDEDEDENSFFRYNTDDDDAREIDSFLEHGIANDIGDHHDEDDDLNFDNDNATDDHESTPLNQ